MNRWCTLFCMMAGAFSGLIGQNAPTKIAFQTGDFEGILAQAQAAQKLVFIDVYTTWCGPCKLLDEKVFTQPAIAQQFNSTFINFKLDAEKGAGPELAKRYGVNAYPTLLFVNGDGELVQRVVGYREAAVLAKDAQQAEVLAKQNAPLSWFQAQYPEKRRDTAFLQAYLNKLNLSEQPNAAVLDELVGLKLALDSTADLDLLELLAKSLQAINGPAFELAVHYAQLVDFKKIKMTSAASRGLRKAYEYQLKAAITSKNRPLLDTLLATIQRIERPNTAKKYCEDFELRFAVAIKDLATIRQIILPIMAEKMALDDAELRRRDSMQFKILGHGLKSLQRGDTTSSSYREQAQLLKNFATFETSSALNRGAWTYATCMTEPAELELALTWAQRATALRPEPYCLDTQAQLLYRLQRKKEAFLTQQQAVDRASADEKTKYQETLQKMMTGKL